MSTPVVTQTSQEMPQLRLRLAFAPMGLVLVVDQLLLPMFHIGPVPFKLSYLMLGLWLLHWSIHDPQTEMDIWRRKCFLQMASAFGVIVGCAALGSIYFASQHATTGHEAGARNLLTFLLVLFAFGLGLDCTRFRINWLFVVVAVSLALNFSFAFLRTSMPAWLVDLYYSRATEDLAKFGVRDVADILELSRPRGLFGNPNASALMVNVIVLFLHVAMRFRLIRTPGPVFGMMLILLPVGLALVLASRGEFIVASLLGLLNFRLFFIRSSRAGRVAILLMSGMVAVGALYAAERLGFGDSIVQSVERIARVFSVLDRAEVQRAGGDVQTDSVARPLLTLQEATSRFVTSPMFGTGYAVSVGAPFDYETSYFHNDWFWMLVTSGVIGTAALVWIIGRFMIPLGAIVLVPFFLPGLINTFMLNIPAMLFYFFMVGVLSVQLRIRMNEQAGLPRV